MSSTEFSALLGPASDEIDNMKDQVRRDRVRRRGLLALVGAMSKRAFPAIDRVENSLDIKCQQ